MANLGVHQGMKFVGPGLQSDHEAAVQCANEPINMQQHPLQKRHGPTAHGPKHLHCQAPSLCKRAVRLQEALTEPQSDDTKNLFFQKTKQMSAMKACIMRHACTLS